MRYCKLYIVNTKHCSRLLWNGNSQKDVLLYIIVPTLSTELSKNTLHFKFKRIYRDLDMSTGERSLTSKTNQASKIFRHYHLREDFLDTKCIKVWFKFLLFIKECYESFFYRLGYLLFIFLYFSKISWLGYGNNY